MSNTGNDRSKESDQPGESRTGFSKRKRTPHSSRRWGCRVRRLDTQK
jgi:hypothetical protein